MDNLKQPDLGRWYALALLFFLLAVIYFLVFHGFVNEHALMNEEIYELEEERKEFTLLEKQIPELQKRIAEVKEKVGDNTNFLQADTLNLGRAELVKILKNIISANTAVSSDCNLVSHTNRIDKDPDQFEKIIINVKMRCHFDKMMKTLSDIENYIPVLFINKLELRQRVTSRRAPRKNAPPPPRPLLDVSFELFAYMNNPIKAREND